MRLSTNRGIALIVVLMTMLFLGAMGAALVMTTSAEALVSFNFRGSQQALYAADAAAEFALTDLAAVADNWPSVLSGATRSWFVDGLPSGKRLLLDGSLLDLTAVVQRNAGWRPYAFGALRELLPAPAGVAGPSPFYIMVFVAADPASSSRLRVRAEAFGPRGGHKVVDLALLRAGPGVQLESWSEVR